MITTETINRIVRFTGNGLPVVSLYVRVPTDLSSRGAMVRSQVDSRLHEIRPMAKDHAQQQSWPPGTVALFSCSGRGFFEQVQLPRGIRDRVIVDETPWVRSMLAVPDEYHRCGVAVVHRDSARMWEFYLDEWGEAGTLRLSADPGRNDHKADELTKRHFRQVVTMLEELLQTHGCELLTIGGPQPELPRFLDFLPSDLRGRVAGTFTVDEATFTVGDVEQRASAVVDRYERSEEQRLVAEAVDTAAAGGLATVGLPPCLWAGSVAAVSQLMVQDEAVTPGVICDHDRWLALDGQTCPLCERPVRQVPDIIDELVEVVIDEGGSIKHVGADTVLKEHLVAASLRFPLPPQPDS
jgi:peptide chain release factor subunit 1